MVAGTVDPDPRVSGSGLQRLRDAGVEAKVGVEERLCKLVNAPFVFRVQHGRPYVIVWAPFSWRRHRRDWSRCGAEGLSCLTPDTAAAATLAQLLTSPISSEADSILLTSAQAQVVDSLGTAIPRHMRLLIDATDPLYLDPQERARLLQRVRLNNTPIHSIPVSQCLRVLCSYLLIICCCCCCVCR